MSWLTLAVISLILAAISNILQSQLTKKSKADIFTLSTLYIGGSYLLLVIYALTLGEIDLVSAGHAWWLLALNVILYPTAHLLIFKALKYLDASLFVIIFSSWVIFTVIGSSLVLDETIDFTQWVGLGLILSGVIAAHSFGKKSKVTSRGITYALAGTIIYGIGGIIDKPLFDRTGFNTFLLVGSGSTALTLLLIYNFHQKIYKKPMLPKRKSFSMMYLVSGVLVLTAAIITFFMALEQLDNIAHLSAVNTFSIMLTVMLGIVLLREKKNTKTKLISACIATVGFLLVI